MRKSDNGAEARLWHALRNRQLNGRKFVRQLGIGPYFADFACRDSMLVVELDGSQHIGSFSDDLRNKYMNEHGWSVARFWSGDVLSQSGNVLDTIAAVCDGEIRDVVRSFDFQFFPAWKMTFAPHPNPLPVNGEREFMTKAIELAKAQMGRTWPNPSVGCVIVKEGRVVGEGATGDGGRPHAEEVALEQAGAAAKGATAYVTLEPCGERSTGAASCGQRLVEAGVARVVYACADPSPLASHKGPTRLQAAGIEVEAGLLRDEAYDLIAGFVHFLETGQPRVVVAEGGAFDAEFTADPHSDLAAELKAWGAKGYRSLFVRPGNPLAEHLAAAGLTAKS